MKSSSASELGALSRLRVGTGYDIHRLVAGRRLLLGGVEIPFSKGLLGHSDGDVLLHAICDAMLGAAAQPDIGQLFPDTDEKWKDADSRVLLRSVFESLKKQGWQLINIDATVVAEEPRLAPHLAAIRNRIAADLGADPEAVGVKATTAEGLGAVGRQEAIAAHASALLYRRTAGEPGSRQ